MDIRYGWISYICAIYRYNCFEPWEELASRLAWRLVNRLLNWMDWWPLPIHVERRIVTIWFGSIRTGASFLWSRYFLSEPASCLMAAGGNFLLVVLRTPNCRREYIIILFLLSNSAGVLNRPNQRMLSVGQRWWTDIFLISKWEDVKRYYPFSGFRSFRWGRWSYKFVSFYP